MGHGLAAAGVAAFALSAYRHSRRAATILLETYAAMDEAVGKPSSRTGASSPRSSRASTSTPGGSTWISAGHPPPLVIRGGRRARPLADHPGAAPRRRHRTGARPTLACEALEPGDLAAALHRRTRPMRAAPDGADRFTLERREASSSSARRRPGQIAPETLRRLRHAIIGREGAELRDDATALLVEWRRRRRATGSTAADGPLTPSEARVARGVRLRARGFAVTSLAKRPCRIPESVCRRAGAGEQGAGHSRVLHRTEGTTMSTQSAPSGRHARP